jgi:hypothetical protein
VFHRIREFLDKLIALLASQEEFCTMELVNRIEGIKTQLDSSHSKNGR